MFDSIRERALLRIRETFPPRYEITPVALPVRLPSIQSPDDFQWPLDFQTNIQHALTIAWSPGTLKTYTSGIKAFLAFCETYRIPTKLVYPASEFLVCAFVASRLGLASSTIKNYLAGLRAWHIQSNYPFPTSARISLIAKAPRQPHLRVPPKKPISADLLRILASDFDFTDSVDIACFACALCAFWGLCRLGELLPTSSKVSTPYRWPTINDITRVPDGFILSLPWTKTGRWTPQKIYISDQLDPLDPVGAIKTHMLVNNPQSDRPFFSIPSDNGFTVLTKQIFLNRVNFIWHERKDTTFTGHSFRIGGTTHYLLAGVHPDIIKKLGRWNSDSFLRYWRFLDHVIPAAVRFSMPDREMVGRRDPRLGHGHASLVGRPRRPAAHSRQISGNRATIVANPGPEGSHLG